mmetsp:Transcript_56041/g.121963  ORF Transcript_56041/g.121963 Transcript_56041/m.121963 type:complete len:143 (+) Transcript_56041:28-456(+)
MNTLMDVIRLDNCNTADPAQRWQRMSLSLQIKNDFNLCMAAEKISDSGSSESTALPRMMDCEDFNRDKYVNQWVWDADSSSHKISPLGYDEVCLEVPPRSAGGGRVERPSLMLANCAGPRDRDGMRRQSFIISVAAITDINL